MKNFYLLLVAALVCIGILPAAAQDAEVNNITFTVNISDAEGMHCSLYGQPIPLVTGKNEISVANGSNLSFYADLPWRMKSVTDKNGTAVSGFYGTSWYLYVNPEIDGQEFTINVINIDEYRTAEFTITVDDPNLVNAVLSGYDQTLSLKAGENTVKYDPAAENYLQLSPVNYSVPFYSVKKNGTEVADMGGSYYNVELEEGCVIDVTAVLPDEDRTVSFSYSDGAEDAITVAVDYSPVDDFNGKELTVKLGSRLEIRGRNDYKFDSVMVNGQEVGFYGSYTFTVMQDSEVYIDAHPYGNISATIIVNNPNLISIYRNGSLIDLSEGETVIECPENAASISWNVSQDAILNSVTVNGGEPLSSYTTYYTLSDKDVVVFDVAEKVFDQEAIVWVDNVAAPAASWYVEFSSQTDRSARYTLDNGYNYISFYQAMNPFSVTWYGAGMNEEGAYKGQAYLNGELLVSPYGEDSTYFTPTISTGDVLKLFLEAAPVECNVSFDIAEGVEASVTKDVIVAVENPAEGFDCFNGTQVAVAGQNLEVKVNGEAVVSEKDEEGNESFTFVVNDPATTVAVAAAGGSAVEAVAAEAETAVFNLQGVRVGSSLKGLAPGIYIVAGKKVVVKE